VREPNEGVEKVAQIPLWHVQRTSNSLKLRSPQTPRSHQKEFFNTLLDVPTAGATASYFRRTETSISFALWDGDLLTNKKAYFEEGEANV
jgi:hypothetical protein